MSFEPAIKERRWDPSMEEEVLKKWEREGAYKFVDDPTKPLFTIDTPPPYPSGRWHVGAAVHYTQIDMVARLYRMLDYSVLFPFGVDRNGLPVEIAVEKKYGVSAHKMDREKFVKLCSTELDKIEAEIIWQARRLGLSCDFTNIYRTDSPEYRALTQATFIELMERGLVYKADKPVSWCPVCGTSIAEAEIEYVERKTKLYYVRFGLSGGGSVTIATTRPELIGACRALIFNPEDDRYRGLVSRKAVVPIYGYEVPIVPHPAAKPEFGTGIMMVCSYGDSMDVLVIKELGLEPRVIIGRDGRLNELAGPFAGLTVEEARKAVVEKLRADGLVEKEEEIVQSVPTCWRTHNPIEFVHVDEYYLRQVEFLDAIKRLPITFLPSWSRKFLENWIKGLKGDWPISRSRYYGTEVPLWYCRSCGKTVLPKPGKYYMPWKEPAPVDACPNCGSKDLIGETKTFDTWFDSSISVLYITRYMKDEEFFKRAFPASLRPQGYEIVRTWLFYTLLRVYQLTGKPAFRYVRISGLGLDEKGEAMSKSKGNIVEIEPLIERYGSDAIRLWGACESKLGSNYRFSEERLAGAFKFLTKLWNIARFVSSFPYVSRTTKLVPLDRMMIQCFYDVCRKIRRDYLGLNFFTPAVELRNFLWNIFADHYLEAVKPRAYNRDKAFAKWEQRSAWYTLHAILKNSLLLLAPIIPFITDKIWSQMYGGSVHNQRIPLGPYRTKRTLVHLLKPFMDFNSAMWRYKKGRGLALTSAVREVYAPRELAVFAEDLKHMHNIGRLEFGKPMHAGYIEVAPSVFIPKQ